MAHTDCQSAWTIQIGNLYGFFHTPHPHATEEKPYVPSFKTIWRRRRRTQWRTRSSNNHTNVPSFKQQVKKLNKSTIDLPRRRSHAQEEEAATHEEEEEPRTKELDGRRSNRNEKRKEERRRTKKKQEAEEEGGS